MAKFVDINSLKEKTLDGSESVQVSDTQKSKLVNILTQLGKNLQMAVPDEDRQTFPALGTTGKVQACRRLRSRPVTISELPPRRSPYWWAGLMCSHRITNI